MDLYGGIRPTFGKLTLDAGFWYYYYPDGQCFNGAVRWILKHFYLPILLPKFATKSTSTVFALFLHPLHPCIRPPLTFAWSIEIATYARLLIQSLTRLDLPWWPRGTEFCCRTEVPGSESSQVTQIVLPQASARYTRYLPRSFPEMVASFCRLV
jgi:hypothetical protein